MQSTFVMQLKLPENMRIYIRLIQARMDGPTQFQFCNFQKTTATSSIQPQCSLLRHKLSQQHVSESTHVLRTLWMWMMRESQKWENLQEGEYELMMALMHIVPRCWPRSKIYFLPGLDFCSKQCMAVHLLDSNRLNVARDSILCLPIPISHSLGSSWPSVFLVYYM